jgi:UDP:flavonoid glycosyltransferase YjiC (YdhE family)
MQPFSKIGKILKKHGHRIRIVTHLAFKTFVEEDISLELLVGGALLGL